MATKAFMKKTNENVKEELLNSLRAKEEDENEDNETENNTANNLTEAVKKINHYEKIIKTREAS